MKGTSLTGIIRLSSLAAIIFFHATAWGASQIKDKISAEEVSELSVAGMPFNLLSTAVDLGPIEPSHRSTLTLYFRSPAQRESLASVVARQTAHDGPLFNGWLTESEVVTRFGLSNSDLEKISGWLKSDGFDDIKFNRFHSSVSFQGTAAQIKETFHTEIHAYKSSGEVHIANRDTPMVPRAISPLVLALGGLHDIHPKARPEPHFTSAESGSHYLAPADVATLYNLTPLYGAGVTGTGVKVAVVGQSDVQTDNILRFWTAAGITQSAPQVVTVSADQDPGFNTADEHEAEADLEWVGAIAPGAQLIYVTSDDAFSSLEYAVDQKLADIIVISYGLCEQDVTKISALEDILASAASQGITVIAASGDFGAADCDAGPNTVLATHGLAVDYPASSQYVTGVGGTSLQDSSGSGFWGSVNSSTGGSLLTYISESAFQDTTSTRIAASGGGFSSLFSQPAWQTGSVQATHRAVPDIALAASPNHDGYLVCIDAGCVNGFRARDNTLSIVGGTSLAGPVAAGLVALLEQKYGPQGVINGKLYSIASFSKQTFHDITVGDNHVPCAISSACPNGYIGYQATVGYDTVTGLGSVDADSLVSQWGADFQLSGPSTITIPGTSATSVITVTAVGNFDSSVGFSCSLSSQLQNYTCAVTDSVTGSGQATLTISKNGQSSTSAFDQFPRLFLPLLSGCLVWLVMSSFCSRRLRLSNAMCCGLLLLSSCGVGTSPSATSTTTSSNNTISGTVTLAASSGQLAHSLSIPVTVQQ